MTLKQKHYVWTACNSTTGCVRYLKANSVNNVTSQTVNFNAQELYQWRHAWLPLDDDRARAWCVGEELNIITVFIIFSARQKWIRYDY